MIANNPRVALDRLFHWDAIFSMITGIIGIITPHIVLVHFVKEYNHNIHEVIRLYASLRLAMGWMLWNVRKVDDGMLRRRICEGMLLCHSIQSFIVLRAQFTEDHLPRGVHIRFWNGMIWSLLTSMAILYGRFRFGRGGNLIKIYELPTASTLS